MATLSVAPGISVYGEKRVSVPRETLQEDGTKVVDKVEYRVWNPFRSKLGAGILAGFGGEYIKPGHTVLYLGAASGTTVSHVADIVGPNGLVVAVEFAERPAHGLLDMSTDRLRVVPVIMDARYPDRYRYFVPGLVDVLFADVAQPDQVDIVSNNAKKYLKQGGMAIISVKANCIDSTVDPTVVYADQVDRLRKRGFKPLEQIGIGMPPTFLFCPPSDSLAVAIRCQP